jgi:hypothetical protein
MPMIRPFLVFCLAFTGTWSLAGRGWALLTAAFLVAVLWRREPDWRQLCARSLATLRRIAARMTAAPRKSTAVTGMTSAVVLLPAGFGFALGLGAALIAGGAALAGVSLLAGWNA